MIPVQQEMIPVQQEALPQLRVDHTGHLNQILFGKTLDAFCMGRLICGINEIGQKKGRWVEVAVIIGGMIGTAVFAGSVYFSGEGSYLLSKDAIEAMIDKDRIPSQIGHAGEWSSQMILYTFVYFWQLKQLVREGDYKKLTKAYKVFLQNLPPDINLDRVYEGLKVNLALIGPQCFFSKNTLTQRIKALTIMKGVDTAQTPCSQLDLDRSLKDIIRRIQDDLKHELGSSRYFRRAWKGFTSIGQDHGRAAQAVALAAGIAMPLFLCVQSFLSFAGAGLVADDVLNHSADRSIVGHIGEWPANGITFAFMAKYLHDAALLNYGDLAVARELMQQHLNNLDSTLNPEEGDSCVHQRVQEVANQELDRLAGRCMFALLPTQYKV